jgi:hypothetical protein
LQVINENKIYFQKKEKMIFNFFKTFISMCLVLVIVSCSNNTNADNASTLSNTAKSMVQPSNAVVGVWKWAGSATDDNDNQKIDTHEWMYKNEKNTKDMAKVGVNVEDLFVTFNADGTGYISSDKADVFTWKEISANNYTSTNKKNEVSKFSLNIKKELIEDTSSEALILGKKRWLVTAELYTKTK